MSRHPPSWQIQCGSVIHPLLDLSGPFKTKQWSAVIVPSAQQHPAESPASCLHLCQPPASLTRFFWSPATSVTSFQGAPQIIFFSFFFPVWEGQIIYEWKWFRGTEDVGKAAAAVHVVVLCLLRGLALLPPPQPQQLCHRRSSVSQRETLY